LAQVAEHTEAAPGLAELATPAALQTPAVWPPGVAAPDTPAALAHQAVAALPGTLPPPEAGRRDPTVFGCALGDSTTPAEHLGAEDFREVVRAHHQACAQVVHQFDGYVAQYLGDGVLAYFGYPMAHEDDVQRAIRTGLGLLEAIEPLNTRLAL